MLVNRYPLALSASDRAEGVLGRLIRALPARSLPDAGGVDAAGAPVATGAARSAGSAPGAVDTLPFEQGLFARVERWLWAQRQRDTEAYLARSVDMCDLESRMRELDRHADKAYFTF